MAVSSGVNLIWKGTNASIPSGYSRNTDMDDKFPKGTANGVNPNDTGGNSTHSHSSVSNHSHNDTHTHTISIGTCSGSGQGRPENHRNINIHTHANFNSGAVSGGGLTSVSSTYASCSNNPPYYEVIFIESDGSKNVPNGAAALSEIDAPTGYTKDADLNGKFLKGAGTGADGGGTGGSTTNVHELDHTHVVNSHTHDSTTSGQRTNGTIYGSNGGDGYAHESHTHTVNITDGDSTAISATNPSLTTNETVQPAYTEMIAVRNNSGSEQPPYEGMVGLWFGTLATIPSGWVLCDGDNDTTDMRGRHLKCTNTVGDLGNTGGSNTHTHAAQNHTHTASGSHTHSHGNVNHTHVDDGQSRYDDNEHDCVVGTDSHPVTVGSSTSSYSNASTSAQSANNEPEYRTVAFIKYEGLTGASFLLNYVNVAY